MNFVKLTVLIDKEFHQIEIPILYMLGLLFTIIKGREQCYQESATHGKIALASEHKRVLIMSNCIQEVARTSARCLGHPARARGEPLRNIFLFL